MKLGIPKCPECHEPVRGSVDLVPGVAEMAKDVLKMFKLPGSSRYFPRSGGYKEAENQAWSDIDRIIHAPDVAMQVSLPQQGENHEAQLAIIEPYYDRWNIATPPDMPGRDMIDRAFQLHITMRKQLLAAEQASQTPMATQGQAGASLNTGEANTAIAGPVPPMPGEVMGEQLSGMNEQATQI